jgi:NAD(P)-dependent dehydrogenase (short-subunit alcohol dehydrogenase family)
MTRPPSPSGLPLVDRVALVTGASRGIGLAIATELAASGAAVVVAARSGADLDRVVAAVESAGGCALAVPTDLTRADDIVELVRRSVGWRGGLDIVVNSAGTVRRTTELDTSCEDWDAVFAINVRASYFVCQEAARWVLANDRTAAFVNVASVAATAVTRANATYGASKAALVQLTRVLAARWAPHIRVNAVGPAYVETDLNRGWLSEPENRDYVLGHTPMGRLGSMEDVAHAVGFLASPAAAYITGTHLLLDGGWTCA